MRNILVNIYISNAYLKRMLPLIVPITLNAFLSHVSRGECAVLQSSQIPRRKGPWAAWSVTHAEYGKQICAAGGRAALPAAERAVCETGGRVMERGNLASMPERRAARAEHRLAINFC